MQLIHFSKHFPDADAKELIRLAQITGAEGYDLAVRPGYAVGPDNVEDLSSLVKTLREAGLVVPMITAPGDFTFSSSDLAPRYLKAMAKSQVPLIKLGYFMFDPARNYWQAVDEIRRELEGWEKLAREYDVTVCYHTHSGGCMGQNASSLAHLIHGFDPQCIGGYLDTGHLLKCGEPFTFASAVIGVQLKIVSFKEYHVVKRDFVCAGEGQVNWDEVFAVLKERDFQGPLSVHTEFDLPEGVEALPKMKEEIAYFKRRIL